MNAPDYIEVEVANQAEFWWRIKNRNGQILATSETYDSMSNARRAAKRFGKRHGIEVRETK